MDKLTIDIDGGHKISIENMSTVVSPSASTEAFAFDGIFDGDESRARASESAATANFAIALLSDIENGAHATSTEGIVGQAVGAVRQIILTVIKALQSIIQWCDSMVTYIVQRIQGAYFKNALAKMLKNHTKEDFVKVYPSMARTEIKSDFTRKFDERAKSNLDTCITLCEQYITAINLNVNVNEVHNPNDENAAGEVDPNNGAIKTFYQKISSITGTQLDEQTSHGNGRKIADKIVLGGKGVGDTPDRASKATIDSIYGQDYLLALVMKGDAAFGEDYKHFANIAKTIRDVKIKTQMVMKFAQVKAAAIGKDNGGGKDEVKLISRQAKVLNFISQFMNESVRIYLSYMNGAVVALGHVFSGGKASDTPTGQVTADEQKKYEGRAQGVIDKQAKGRNLGTRADKLAEQKAAQEKAKQEHDAAVARVDERLRQEEAAAVAEEQAAKDARAKARAKAKRVKAREAAAAEKRRLAEEFKKRQEDYARAQSDAAANAAEDSQ